MSLTPIVLASTSPRRQAFLHALGLEFTVVAANIDETPRAGEMPIALATRLAAAKARAVRDTLAEPALIIAADTVVALDDTVMGKPRDAAEARRMLTALRGREHHVISAVSLLDGLAAVQRTHDSPAAVQRTHDGLAAVQRTHDGPADVQRTHDGLAAVQRTHDGLAAVQRTHDGLAAVQRTIVNDTRVTMRLYTDDEIDAYIATGDPFDKAGGYAIQHAAFRPVTALSGCFAGVMGLPLADLIALLAQAGVVITADARAICAGQGAWACCSDGRSARGDA